MTGGLHLGLIGSAETRTLWEPGQLLDASQMLSRAYKGEVTLHLISKDERRLSDAHVFAGDRAKDDLKRYVAVQKNVASPTSYPRVRHGTFSTKPSVPRAVAEEIEEEDVDLSALEDIE
jgi:hypothetical protein